MPFQKGHKYGKGGKREGAGRPSSAKKEIKLEAEEIARKFIEEHVKEVLDTYLDNAKGHYEKRWTDGKEPKEYEVWVVDAATTRHYVDKLVPAVKQQLEISGSISHDDTREQLRELSKHPDAVDLTRQFAELMIGGGSSRPVAEGSALAQVIANGNGHTNGSNGANHSN